MLLCECMFYYYVCTAPGHYGVAAACSGQKKKSIVSYKYLPDSACVPSTETWSEAFSLGTIPLGKSLVTAEPAFMLMALIYTQEDLEPLRSTLNASCLA